MILERKWSIYTKWTNLQLARVLAVKQRIKTHQISILGPARINENAVACAQNKQKRSMPIKYLAGARRTRKSKRITGGALVENSTEIKKNLKKLKQLKIIFFRGEKTTVFLKKIEIFKILPTLLSQIKIQTDR